LGSDSTKRKGRGGNGIVGIGCIKIFGKGVIDIIDKPCFGGIGIVIRTTNRGKGRDKRDDKGDTGTDTVGAYIGDIVGIGVAIAIASVFGFDIEKRQVVGNGKGNQIFGSEETGESRGSQVIKGIGGNMVIDGIKEIAQNGATDVNIVIRCSKKQIEIESQHGRGTGKKSIGIGEMCSVNGQIQGGIDTCGIIIQRIGPPRELIGRVDKDVGNVNIKRSDTRELHNGNIRYIECVIQNAIFRLDLIKKDGGGSKMEAGTDARPDGKIGAGNIFCREKDTKTVANMKRGRIAIQSHGKIIVGKRNIREENTRKERQGGIDIG